MEDVDLRETFTSIRAPCLVIHRRADVIVPVGNGRALAECIPHSEYLELPGTDHLWWTGDQEAITDAIRSFLTRTR
jgi:pimeloyl-ACP methyl ester carboxylesterase